MNQWRTNLAILWVGQFMVMAGMTMIVPFLPLYIQELGITDKDSAAIWAGVIFAGNFLTAFIFQPFWGKMADRYGRKMMLLRSGFGMAIVMVLMGQASTVWQLLLLRLLNGTISGFIPAAISLVSANTPKNRIGVAMGVIQSGAVAGTILGPFIGGILAESIGFRPIFLVTGILVFLATLFAMLLVKESFDRKEAQAQKSASVFAGLKELWKIPQLPSLFGVTFMIQFALLSAMPLLPLYIQDLHGPERAAFYAGLVGAITGVSNMIASPLLGRLSDRLGGAERILLYSLLASVVVTGLQAFVPNITSLLILRFLQGICMGGMLPSVNSLVRKFTPDGMESRAYSFNSSFLSLGNMIGPVIGGVCSVWIGIEGIFIVGSVMMLINVWWTQRSLKPTPLEQIQK